MLHSDEDFKEADFAKVVNVFPLCIPGKMLHGCVSQRLESTEFANLIGWNWYWKRSTFSHLDRHLHSDRLCFAGKKVQTKMQRYWLFSSNNIYLLKCQKVWWEKKLRIRANFGRIKFSSSPFANKVSVTYKLVTINKLHCSSLPYNKYLINRV